MNNKGFTLIELLSIIAIIALLGIVFTVNYTKSIEVAHQKECDLFVKELEDAACVYAGLSAYSQDPNYRCASTLGTCDLTVPFLVSQGLVKSEIDPCTGNSVDAISNSVKVEVTWSDGNKTCTYKGVKTYAR